MTGAGGLTRLPEPDTGEGTFPTRPGPRTEPADWVAAIRAAAPAERGDLVEAFAADWSARLRSIAVSVVHRFRESPARFGPDAESVAAEEFCSLVAWLVAHPDYDVRNFEALMVDKTNRAFATFLDTECGHLPAAGMIGLRRRQERLHRAAEDLLVRLGRPATDEEILAEANRAAAANRSDPVRQGMRFSPADLATIREESTIDPSDDVHAPPVWGPDAPGAGRLTGLDRKRLASRVIAEGSWTLDADGRVDGWFADAADFLWSGQLAETAEDIPTTGELSDHFGAALSWERVRAIRTWLVAELARDILADEFGIGDTGPFASPLLVRGAAATVVPALAGFCRRLRPGPVDVSGPADASLALALAAAGRAVVWSPGRPEPLWTLIHTGGRAGRAKVAALAGRVREFVPTRARLAEVLSAGRREGRPGADAAMARLVASRIPGWPDPSWWESGEAMHWPGSRIADRIGQAARLAADGLLTLREPGRPAPAVVARVGFATDADQAVRMIRPGGGRTGPVMYWAPSTPAVRGAADKAGLTRIRARSPQAHRWTHGWMWVTDTPEAIGGTPR